MYPKSCPAKRRRALVETNSPRDNRTGWRRISVRGGPLRPPHPQLLERISRAIPYASKTPGVRGQSPRLQVDIFPEQLADIIPEQQQDSRKSSPLPR